EPRRSARRHRPRDHEHGRDHEQRVAEEAVDGEPEHRDDEDERGELEPRLRPRRRGAAIIGVCGVQCSAPGFAVGVNLSSQSCAGRGTPPTRSAGTPLTRASIFFARRSLRRWMDCRVKPGNDNLRLAPSGFAGRYPLASPLSNGRSRHLLPPLIPAKTGIQAIIPNLGPRCGVPATRASRGAPRGDERRVQENPPMPPVLALYEDVLSDGAALALPAAARM